MCIDGFSGLFTAYSAGLVNNDVNIIPAVPGAPHAPPGIIDKNVLIIDVAFKLDVIKDIISKCKRLTFIDHHVSIRDDMMEYIEDELKGKTEKENLTVIYDDNRAGCTLAWKHLLPERKIPLFMKYVEDNDIGAWRHEKTKFFIFGLSSNYNLEPTMDNLKEWEKLTDHEEVHRLCMEGIVIDKYNNKLLDKIFNYHTIEKFPSKKIQSQFNTFFDKVGKYKVAVHCGSDCPSSTGIGLKLLNETDCDFAFIWSLDISERKYYVSLRSKEVDVGSIAKIFGGGGHKLASGFSMPTNIYNILDLFESNTSKKRR
jgi:oligoribonuclease NrnB/cAMP/cGMP phosphodiesterase (DHH superfamily)